MDNFAIIYKILKALEKAMDYEEFDVSLISHERLDISYSRWEKIMIMLKQSGYIEGIVYDQALCDYSPTQAHAASNHIERIGISS